MALVSPESKFVTSTLLFFAPPLRFSDLLYLVDCRVLHSFEIAPAILPQNLAASSAVSTALFRPRPRTPPQLLDGRPRPGPRVVASAAEVPDGAAETMAATAGDEDVLATRQLPRYSLVESGETSRSQRPSSRRCGDGISAF